MMTRLRFYHLWVSRHQWRYRPPPATCGPTSVSLAHPMSLLPLRISQGGGLVALMEMTHSRRMAESKLT